MKNKKEKQEKLRKTFWVCIGLIILFVVFYLIYFINNFTYVVYNSELNKVCMDYGYEKATDSRYVYPREYSGNDVLILIECDNKVITNKINRYWESKWFEIKIFGNDWCTSYDKWGDCKYYNSNKTKVILH